METLTTTEEVNYLYEPKREMVSFRIFPLSRSLRNYGENIRIHYDKGTPHSYCKAGALLTALQQERSVCGRNEAGDPSHFVNRNVPFGQKFNAGIV